MPFMALSHNHLIDNLTRSEFIVGITRPMALLYKTLHIYSVVPSSDKQRSLYKQVQNLQTIVQTQGRYAVNRKFTDIGTPRNSSPSGRRDSVTEPGLWTMHRPARAPGRSPARKT